MKICCFTGHRTIPENDAPTLVRLLDENLLDLYEKGFREFRTGGAKGFDTLAALRVLALKRTHPECKLHLMLPCPDQDKGWSAGQRAVFEDIKKEANAVRYLSDIYTPTCMHQRNRALVDGSDLCVAYLRENRGGTLYTCSYALKSGVELLNLAELLPKK